MQALPMLVLLMFQVSVSAAASECMQQQLTRAAEVARHQDTASLEHMIAANFCPALQASWKQSYLAGYLNYRLADALVSVDRSQADKALDLAVLHFKHSIELHAGCAECHAMLSSAYGLTIGLHPLRGITLGPPEANLWYGHALLKTGQQDGHAYIQRALELDPGYVLAQQSAARP